MDQKEVELKSEIFNLKENIEETRKEIKFWSKKNAKESFNKCKIWWCLWVVLAVVLNKYLEYSLIGIFYYSFVYTVIGLMNRAFGKKDLSSLEEELGELEKELKSYQISEGMKKAYVVEWVEVKNPYEKISELEHQREILLSLQEEDVIGEESEDEMEGKKHNYRPKNRL